MYFEKIKEDIDKIEDTLTEFEGIYNEFIVELSTRVINGSL